MRKSQGSLELMLLLAISLVVVISIIAYSNQTMGNYEKVLQQKKADAMLDKIHTASVQVYEEGVGAKKRIYVSVPDSVDNISINENSMEVNFYDGTTQHRGFEFDIAGNISETEGGKWLEVKSKQGVVLISRNVSAIEEDYENCGNNIINIGEECDGTNLDGKTCSYFGYHSGDLDCKNCVFNTQNCTPEPGENCSDGIDNDLDGYIDCQDSDCALTILCLPENCEDRTFCGQCTLDGACTWCEGGPSGSRCYDSCKKGRWDNCFGGLCIGDQTSCP